MAEINY